MTAKEASAVKPDTIAIARLIWSAISMSCEANVGIHRPARLYAQVRWNGGLGVVRWLSFDEEFLGPSQEIFVELSSYVSNRDDIH